MEDDNPRVTASNEADETLSSFSGHTNINVVNVYARIHATIHRTLRASQRGNCIIENGISLIIVEA